MYALRSFLSKSPHTARIIFLSSALVMPFFHFAYAQDAAPVAGYSPGARSTTSANTMIDSVVGNSHSPIKNQTSATGELYIVASDGTITAPNGLIVNPGCSKNGPHSGPTIHSKYRIGLKRRGKDFETVTIGVSDQPREAFLPEDKNHPTIRRATLSASFAPTGLYVLPLPCAHAGTSDHALTMSAASALAAADGNIFSLAGNRAVINNVDTAHPLPNGDIQLTSSSTDEKTTP
ncbi:hypothetical protein GS501_02305 [Saccharibacter sp. 17.LH.SD]|uniref:hypothetical protein n=1 Tax=Saccharibacter sp. 17.LH.SD TaxID=2689393 RepID=UPI001370EE81|nr:hypothetical protein [Saccharibacter sp. 17.LH.SD]MXV43884.1 hypothetical protein [Saccharibacter sp. 17.LH.SD]